MRVLMTSALKMWRHGMKKVRSLIFLFPFLFMLAVVKVTTAQTPKDTGAKEEVVAVINENRIITQREIDELLIPQLYSLQERFILCA